MKNLKELALNRIVRVDSALREKVTRLQEQSESGLEQSTWTAIIAVGGGVLAITLLGALTAWAMGYIGKLPG
jgi:hypothetical protein